METMMKCKCLAAAGIAGTAILSALLYIKARKFTRLFWEKELLAYTVRQYDALLDEYLTPIRRKKSD